MSHPIHRAISQAAAAEQTQPGFARAAARAESY